MGKSDKGDNSVMALVISPKVNQVIYTLDITCEPNILILVQVVLEILGKSEEES